MALTADAKPLARGLGLAGDCDRVRPPQHENSMPPSRRALSSVLCIAMACGSPATLLPTATTDNLALPAPASDAPRTHISGRSLIVRNATLIDGVGGPPLGGIDVWVEDGRIHAIGPDLVTLQRPEIDATGLTVLPGLISTHAHVQSVPGSVLRGDDTAAVEAQQKLQLRAYLASGITTVLDPAIGPDTARRLRAWIDDGHPGPELFVLAPFITPAKGYMTSEEMRGAAFEEFWPAVDASTDLDALFADARPLRPSGAKVAIEDGVVFSNLPEFDDETLGRIRRSAERNNVRLFVHSMANADHRRALEMNPYALVHVGLWDDIIAPDILHELQRRGTYVMSTITLKHLAAWGWNRDFEDDPWVRQRVPLVQWETATHPDALRQLSHITADMMRPGWIPLKLAQAGAPMFTPSADDVAAATASGVAAIAALQEAGVPWVVGADEGNSPAYTTFFHGVGTQIELEQLDAGGIPRDAILAACTRRPAQMLGVEHRIGTLEVGKQADLILVADNPLEQGMVALRTIQWTIRDGEARSPASWLADP